MIEKGKLTLIDGNTYMVMKIEDGMAHLKDMVNPKGRPRKMSVERVPYFNEEGEFIVPEVKSLPKFNVSGKISLRAMVKEYTDMSVSRDFIGFLKLWIEGAIEDLVIGAEENAKREEPFIPYCRASVLVGNAPFSNNKWLLAFSNSTHEGIK